MKKEAGKIVSGGAGGFLYPPKHPQHSLHVESDLRRRPDNRSSLSLSYALTCDWLDDKIKQEAKSILDNWEKSKPSLQDPEVQEWIHHVLGYFKPCYVRPYATRNASDLLIDSNLNPLANSHMHAGVAFIRDFYPDFHPNLSHFKNSKIYLTFEI